MKQSAPDATEIEIDLDTPLPSELIASTIRVVEQVPIDKIQPSPLNPRRAFGSIDELAASIRAQGVVSPLLVRIVVAADHPLGPAFEIVDGERRYRAARQAGLATVPVLVRELEDDEVLEIQLLSAIQRQDLTPLEEARGYKALIDSNRSKYSAAYIADRISRSERYVWDRMRLLDLVPELRQLLEREVILVGHAELLAKLKPEDQQRAIAVGDGARMNHRDDGGLWARVGRTLDFNDGGDEDDDGAFTKDAYRGCKPVTVRELEAWIARHVRFDVEHAALTAPLEFGETAIAVETAQAKTGRGKKVVAITEDYRVEDDARDPAERVYGQQSWKRADDSAAAAPCEHSVLGVVAVGPGYGQAFQVCIAKDRCQVHWKVEIRAREKNRKLRESGQGAKADAREKKQEETWEERSKREGEERARQLAAYQAVYPQLLAAVTKALPSDLNRTAFGFLYRRAIGGTPPAVKPGKFIETLVLGQITREKPKYAWSADRSMKHVLEAAKEFGVEGAPFAKAYANHIAAAKKADTGHVPAAAPSRTKGKKPTKQTASRKR